MTDSVLHESLRLSQQIHDTAEQIACTGSWQYDLQNNTLGCSANLYRLYGYEPNGFECSPENLVAFTHPEDRQAVGDALNKAVAERQPFDMQFRIITKAGEERHVRKLGKIFEEKGLQYLIGVVQDITEQKKSEEQIGSQFNLISKISETLPDIISVFNLREYKLEYINHRHAEVFGYNDTELMDMTLEQQRELINDDDKLLVREYFQGFLIAADDDVRIVEYRASGKDGLMQWFRSRGKVFKRDESGAVTHCLNVVQNIHQHKIAEEGFRKHQELLKVAERMANLGSWERNVVTDELVWSEELYHLYGHDPAESIASSEYFIQNIVHPDDRVFAAAYIKSLRKGNEEPAEYRIVTPKGSERWVMVKAKMEYDAKGALAFIRGITLDITDQKIAEQELKNLNKALVRKNKDLQNLNDELNNFAYITGHDLKEPMRKVYSFLEMLANKESSKLSDEGRSYLKRAQAALQRMSLLTDDILAFTEINTRKENKVKLDLNNILSYVVNNLRLKIERTATVIEVDSLPTVKGYRSLISHLFYHLLDNAIKFRQEGMKPHIKLTGTVLKGIEIDHAEAVDDTNYVKLEFADNGQGFDAADIDKIFEMFTRLHAKDNQRGTGIGLAICKKIVDRHHGFIITNSAPGKGAVFNIYLPL